MTKDKYEAAIRWLEIWASHWQHAADCAEAGGYTKDAARERDHVAQINNALAIVREARELASLPVEEPIPEVDDASDETVRSGLDLAWQLVKGERYAATSDERKLAVVALNMQGKRDALNRRLRAEVPDAR